MKFKAGALFAGIGGFCEGFKKMDIETAWAIDVDERVGRTYAINHQAERFILEDISKVSNGMTSSAELEPVDVLHAGFLCQNFSMAGASV